MIMDSKQIILIIALIFSNTFLFAQKKEDKIEVELSKCLKSSEGSTTVGMCNCTYEALDKWDKKLNVVYKKLLATVDTSTKQKLIDTQRQWLKFKESEINLIDATYGNQDGTMWLIVRAEKVMVITKEGNCIRRNSFYF